MEPLVERPCIRPQDALRRPARVGSVGGASRAAEGTVSPAMGLPLGGPWSSKPKETGSGRFAGFSRRLRSAVSSAHCRCGGYRGTERLRYGRAAVAVGSMVASPEPGKVSFIANRSDVSDWLIHFVRD